VSSANSQTRLVSFLTASSDPDNYGQLQSFVMPAGQTVSGPVQVNNAILRAPLVSSAITFLNQQGSSVIQGSMQLIPVGNSIVYVRPFYAQSRQAGAFPQFQFVVVYSQGTGDAYCGQTVQDGLDQLLQLTPRAPCSVQASTGDNGTTSTTTTTTTPTATTKPGSATTTVPQGGTQDLLNQAAAKLDQAQQALANQDLGTYQKLVKDAHDLIRQAQQKAGG
jgi:uncharacterized membrane protein (UPF0182 family)